MVVFWDGFSFRSTLYYQERKNRSRRILIDYPAAGRWHYVMAVFDGSKKGAAALAIYVDGRNTDLEVNNNALGPNIETDAPFRLGGRTDQAGASDTLTGGKVFAQNLTLFEQALKPQEIARLASDGNIHLVYNLASDGIPYYLKSSGHGTSFSSPIAIVDKAARKPGLEYSAVAMAVGVLDRHRLRHPREDDWQLDSAIFVAPLPAEVDEFTRVARKGSEQLLGGEEEGVVGRIKFS